MSFFTSVFRFPALGIVIIALVGCGPAQQAVDDTGQLADLAIGSTAKETISAAMTGGSAGAFITAQMDQQAQELEQMLEGADIERAGEAIILKFDTGLLFDFDSSELSEKAKETLTKLSESLKNFNNTEVLVIGHTDAIGSERYNQGLSERRAKSAKDFLVSLDVEQNRLTSQGRGETEPIAGNDTDEGRLLNRRVEVVIFAGETLLREAQEQS